MGRPGLPSPPAGRSGQPVPFRPRRAPRAARPRTVARPRPQRRSSRPSEMPRPRPRQEFSPPPAAFRPQLPQRASRPRRSRWACRPPAVLRALLVPPWPRLPLVRPEPPRLAPPSAPAERRRRVGCSAERQPPALPLPLGAQRRLLVLREGPLPPWPSPEPPRPLAAPRCRQVPDPRSLVAVVPSPRAGPLPPRPRSWVPPRLALRVLPVEQPI
jgi:hypothetical protein